MQTSLILLLLTNALVQFSWTKVQFLVLHYSNHISVCEVLLEIRDWGETENLILQQQREKSVAKRLAQVYGKLSSFSLGLRTRGSLLTRAVSLPTPSGQCQQPLHQELQALTEVLNSTTWVGYIYIHQVLKSV